MASLRSLGPVLAGGLAGAILTGGAIWVLREASPGRRLALVLAAVILGAAAGRWIARSHERSLRWLRRRLDSWTPGDAVGQAMPEAAGVEAEVLTSIRRISRASSDEAARSRADRRHLEEILDSMSDGVLVTSQDLRVELVNPAFRAQFASQAAMAGQTVLELSRSPQLVGFLEQLESSAEIAERRIDTEAGRALELRGRRLVGDRLVVVARDLTEQRRLDETRRDLVANVSHELRTPLTAIRGYAENLSEGALEDPETATRFIDRILAQCRRLEALLEDLLALSRLEKAEQAPVVEAVVDLKSLAQRSLETVRGLATERQVSLSFEPQAAPTIAGSEEALERLLLNLLENAIKYNRDGGTVVVELACRGGEVVLAVADSGIGVPQRDLPRIFERFYRVDSGRSREEGGTGLGLAIVKHAAQLHGGRVEVESELGRGSVFRVYLPASA